MLHLDSRNVNLFNFFVNILWNRSITRIIQYLWFCFHIDVHLPDGPRCLMCQQFVVQHHRFVHFLYHRL